MENKRMPQFGEEAIIKDYFSKFSDGFYVDIGAGGRWSNVDFLDGWKGLKFDKENGIFITAENINALLDILKAPETIDLLSIDIDGNDYYIWETITRKAKMVIIEFNKTLPDGMKHEYKPDFVWDGSDVYGASRKAIIELAGKKQMQLLTEIGDNLIFIENA